MFSICSVSMCRVQKKWSDMAVALSCTKTDVKKKLCQSKEMLPQLLVNQHFENSTTAGCSDFDEGFFEFIFILL